MDESIKLYITIIIEVILIGVFVVILSALNNTAQRTFMNKEVNDEVTANLTKYRELFPFVSTDEVTGDDIVRFVGVNTKSMNMYIVLPSRYLKVYYDDIQDKWVCEEKRKVNGVDEVVLHDGVDAWTSIFIADWLADYMTNIFTVTTNYDKDNDIFRAITFTVK